MRPPSSTLIDLCNRHSDDSFIAAYLRREGYSCPTRYVERFRAKMIPKRPPRGHGLQPAENLSENARFDAMIRHGSEKLLAAILRYYEVRRS